MEGTKSIENSKCVLDDLMSPYCLAGLNVKSVTIQPLLTGPNYLVWREDFMRALTVQNKQGFLDGKIKAPTKEDDPMNIPYARNDALILSWIINSVSTEIATNIRYEKSGVSVWFILEERFSRVERVRTFTLERKIREVRQGPGMKVMAYFTRLNGLWQELDAVAPWEDCDCKTCACNFKKKVDVKVRESRVFEFLMGLNENYETLRGQIVLMDPFPDINTVFNMVEQEEQRREAANTPKIEGSAFVVKKEYRGKTFTIPFCDVCQKQGHHKSKCWRVVGYPSDGYQRFGDRRGQVRSNMVHNEVNPNEDLRSMRLEIQKLAEIVNGKTSQIDHKAHSVTKTDHLANVTGNTPIKDLHSFILDTGATDHMVCDESLLITKQLVHNSCVHMPNGTTAPISHKGTIKIFENLLLENVLCVPSFRHNLISILKICVESKLQVCFSDIDAHIQDPHSKTLIGTANAHHGLYQIHQAIDATSQPPYAFSVSFDLWHARLGHLSNEGLRQIQQSCKSVSISKDFLCDICPLAKQIKPSFKNSVSSTNALFYLLHCDVWGPYNTVCLQNCTYFLTIVDDYSRTTWVSLIKQKSDVQHVLDAFLRMIKTQFDAKVKIIRSDNGGEFHLPSLYSSHGIIHQTTCPYTPQQNGKVERKHQHLLNVARALLFQANLPLKFWGDAISTACFLINRTPTPVLNNKTPHEIMFGTLPKYENLRVFGSLCYASTLPVQRTKFDARAVKCIFIGYPQGVKGYKLYNLETHKSFVSRNVIFHESVFPFKEHLQNHSPNFDGSPNGTFFETGIPLHMHASQDTQTQPIEAEVHEPSSPEPRSPSSEPTSPSTEPCSSDYTPSSESTMNMNSPCDEPTFNQESTSSHQNEHTSADSSLQTTLRRSQRVRRPPPLNSQGYRAFAHKASTSHPIENYMTYSRLSPKHYAFTVALDSQKEPSTYDQAVVFEHWRRAIDDELDALEENNTWSVVPLPKGKSSIGCRYVFKVKLKADGTLDKYKARLVAKGYTQKEGFDYTETFSPVAKITTVRIFFAIGASLGWSIRQFDVHNAFLNGDLEEDIYMNLPPGLRFQGASSSKPRMVCKLHKSIYGLKQASRTWNSTFTQALLDVGFVQSKADYSLYTRSNHEGFVALLVYVDDILVGSSNEELIEEVKKHLFGKFKTRDLGEVKYFLGIEVARSEKGIHLCQRKYTLEILEEIGMKGCKVAITPIEQNHKLRKHEESPLEDATSYRKLVGKLIYLSITRPDITYAVNVLSQFMSSPQKDHMDGALRVLRYLKGTIGKGILLSSKSELKLKGYSDSDWASCPDTRRSTTGYCVFIGESLVSWRTKKQVTVSRSSTEAEYRAIAHTTAEMTWIEYLMRDFEIKRKERANLFCDNQAAIYLTKNPVFHERTKHVEIDCHFVREKFQEGFIQPIHIDTKRQLADVFTKALPSSTLDFLLSNMGMLSIHSHIEGKCQNTSMDERTAREDEDEKKVNACMHGKDARMHGKDVRVHEDLGELLEGGNLSHKFLERENAWKRVKEKETRGASGGASAGRAGVGQTGAERVMGAKGNKEECNAFCAF